MADTKSDYDVLNTVIDLSKDDSLKRPGDFIVKLGRPKKKSKQERVEEEGDRYIAELGSNDRENTHDDYLRENPYLVDFDPSNLDNIKEIKWGDFDVEKLVDFLVMVSEKLSTDKLYPYQQEFQRRVFRSILLNDGETLTALFSRQSGKCHGKGTPIMMFDGTTKPVEEVKVGDLLMGDDSTPRRVLELVRGEDDLYNVKPRIKASDSFVVNSDHILVLKERTKPGDYREVEISVKDYLNYPNWKKADGVRGFKVPVNYPEKPTPVDPYWLGLWLGDGYSSGVPITTVDTEIVDYLESYAKELGLQLSVYKNSVPCYAITGRVIKDKPFNPLRAYLKSAGLINNKHIPEDYLFNSREVRLKLLAGLIDSDGHRAKASGKEHVCEITFSNENLAKGLVTLFRSLGYRCAIKEKLATITKLGYESIVYRVTAYGDFSIVPTKLPRKQWPAATLREDPLTFGFDLEYLGRGDFYGFTIDGNHRYLLGDFTVTHNSHTTSLTITTLCTVMPALAEQFPKQLGDYRKGFWVGIFAPTTHQARIVYDRVILTSQSSSAQEVYDDPDIATSLEKRKGYWKNGSFCVMQTASTKASIEGHTLHLILLEETQGIDEGVILRSIDPMGAFTNATTISIGTCDENPCWFYDMIQINKMRDVKVPPIYKNHFEYDYTEVIKYNEKYKRHVEKKIRERGIDSRWFQMKYGLRWFFEEGRPITDSDYKRFMQHITVPLTHTTDAPVVVGIDIGYERNASVVTVGKLIDVVMEYSDEKEVIRAVQICDWLELEKRPYPEQRPLIKSFLQHYPNIHCITIDTTGVGVQFFQEAELEWGGLARHMEMFKFNPPSKNYLMNLFYEYFWKRRIIIPSDKTTRLTKKWQSFYLQLLNLQKVVKKGYAVLEKNEREGSRDDFPDSLFLMLHAAEVATKRYRPIEQGPGQIYKDPHYPKARGMQEIRDAIREKRFGKRDSIRQQRAEKLLRGNIR